MRRMTNWSLSSRAEPRVVILLPLPDAILAQLDIDALAEDLNGRQPALLRLVRRVTKKLRHGGIGHAAKRRGTGLQAIEAVEDPRFAQTFDEIYSFEPAGQIGGRLRRDHAQIWNPGRIVHLRRGEH